MTAAWKLEAEKRLMSSEHAPEVVTTGTLAQLAAAGVVQPPSRATVQRWQRDLVASSKLREITKGVYLNQLGYRDTSPAAAADWVRARSVVSLAWVLEQAGVTNNFGDTITCVIPTDPSWPIPNVGDRQTAAGMFRFFAMPARLVLADWGAGKHEDIRDIRFTYPRCTPEKALLDWIYLGNDHRSRMTPPPMDLDVSMLDRSRLNRIARSMGMTVLLTAWLDAWQRHQAHEDVRDNRSHLLDF